MRKQYQAPEMEVTLVQTGTLLAGSAIGFGSDADGGMHGDARGFSFDDEEDDEED